MEFRFLAFAEDVVKDKLQRILSKRLKHEKYGAGPIVIVQCIGADKFNVASCKAAISMILDCFCAKVRDDLNSDGTACSHPTCSKHCAPHPGSNIREHIVLTEANPFQQTKDIALGCGLVMKSTILISFHSHSRMKPKR